LTDFFERLGTLAGKFAFADDQRRTILPKDLRNAVNELTLPSLGNILTHTGRRGLSRYLTLTKDINHKPVDFLFPMAFVREQLQKSHFTVRVSQHPTTLAYLSTVLGKICIEFWRACLNQLKCFVPTKPTPNATNEDDDHQMLVLSPNCVFRVVKEDAEFNHLFGAVEISDAALDESNLPPMAAFRKPIPSGVQLIM
jgi:hypothetical protein